MGSCLWWTCWCRCWHSSWIIIFIDNLLKRIYPFFAFLIAYLVGVAVGIYSGIVEYSPSTTNKMQREYIFSENEFDRFISIAKNNTIVGLKNLLVGFFSLGLLSVFYSFYNGFVLGFAIGKYSKVLNTSDIFKTTLPHCSEIIGIVLMGYLGFVLSIRILFNKCHLSKKIFFILFITSLFIIVISAFLESYVSMSVQ